jgi:hypothetical protein
MLQIDLNLYSHTKGPKAIRDLANAMGSPWQDNAGNFLSGRRDAGRALAPGGAAS